MTDRLAAAVADLVAAIREEVAAEANRAPVKPRLLDVREAAARTSLSRSNFYKILMAGEIRSVRIGGRRLISEAALNDFIASAEGTAAPSIALAVSPESRVHVQNGSHVRVHRQRGRARGGSGSPG